MLNHIDVWLIAFFTAVSLPSNELLFHVFIYIVRVVLNELNTENWFLISHHCSFKSCYFYYTPLI